VLPKLTGEPFGKPKRRLRQQGCYSGEIKINNKKIYVDSRDTVSRNAVTRFTYNCNIMYISKQDWGLEALTRMVFKFAVIIIGFCAKIEAQ